MRALEELADAGAQVSVHVTDLDSGTQVLAGDDHVTLPVAGLGVVPLLIEVASRFEAGTLDPLDVVDRSDFEAVTGSGLWRSLRTPLLPLVDLVILAATAGDPLAVNILLDQVGHHRVRDRIESLGLRRTAVLDRFTGVLAGYPLTGTVGEITTVDADTVTATTEVAGPHGGAPMPLTFEQIDGTWVIADESACSILAMGTLSCE